MYKINIISNLVFPKYRFKLIKNFRIKFSNIKNYFIYF